jgi:hypothetical protein
MIPRWAVAIFFLSILFFLAGGLFSVYAQEVPTDIVWNRMGTVMSTVGAVLGLIAVSYAAFVAIRTDRSLNRLDERADAQMEELKRFREQSDAQAARSELAFQKLNEQIDERAQRDKIAFQELNERSEAQMEELKRFREQSDAQAARSELAFQELHKQMREQGEELHEQIREQGERERHRFQELFWDLQRRGKLSDTIQQLTSRSTHIFLELCKKQAQQQGYLNLMLRPERHYEINQRGIDLLTALSPFLPEWVADLKPRELSDPDLLFELNIPTLYGLMENVLHLPDPLTFEALLGVVVVYAHGGSDLVEVG